MKKIEVVAAVIINKNQILGVQRPLHKLEYISNKFEFPGGKIEINESNEEALYRELKEELNLNSKIGDHFISVVHNYPDFELTMHTYLVNVESRDLTLNEHISKVWLSKHEIKSVDWAAADIPIVEKLSILEWQTL